MLLQPTLLMSAFVVCLILSSRSNNIPVTDNKQVPPSKTTQQQTVPEDSLMVSEYEPVKKPVKLTPPVVTNHARIITSKGTMIVELYGKDAPKTVANFVKLSKNNFYNFMIESNLHI